MLAALLPKLEPAHAAVFALVGQNDDPETARLSAEASRLDAEHDDLVRTIHTALTVLSKVSKTGDEILRLRDQLFPEGLKLVKKSHREEAGHAAALASTMNADLQARMKAVPIGDGTVLDLVNRYLDVGKQLGAVAEQRARLERPATSQAAQAQAARREWIRWTNILVATAENAEVPPEVDTLLFSALRAAVDAARPRWGNHGDAPAPAPVPAPGPSPALLAEAK
jgi:hypothetical protein